MIQNTFLRWFKQLKRLPVRWGQTPSKRTPKYSCRLQLEGLEERVVPAATPITPLQLRAAYGIDEIRFGASEVVGNGAGQTIAIAVLGIDATLVSDLQHFDTMVFGTNENDTQLLDTFAKDSSGNYTDTGPVAGSTKPWLDVVQDTNPSFPPTTATSQEDVEAAEDVEWAHVVAPMANILVVETGSIQSGTYFAGELQTQDPQLDISVIASSSFHFPQFIPGDYFNQNVAYVGITGDTGALINSQLVGFSNNNYPASSPLVIAVGGTTLTLNPDGSYGSETGWGFAGPNRFLTSSSATYAPAGAWTATPGGFSGSYDTTAGGNPNNPTATWTTTILSTDTLGQNDQGLELSATWTPSPSNSANAQYLIYDNGNLLDTVTVDQQLAPEGTPGTQGSTTATFQELCALTGRDVPTTAGPPIQVGDTITVVLEGQVADGNLVADAIGIGPDDASGGGFSNEAQPSYQNGLVIHDGNSIISSGGFRTSPDVAFDADYVNSPVEIYTQGSVNNHVGGTSLGAPAWAALLAIADQGLATVGAAPMNTEQALTALYQLPSYDFHDETSGYNGYSAGPGYDLVTGLGSPVANQLIPDLDNYVLYLDNPVLDSSNSEPRVNSPLIYEAPEGQGANNLEFFRLGPIMGIANNGQIVATSQVLYTPALDIIGAENTSNTLTIGDFGASLTGVGFPPPIAYPVGLPVTFDGGGDGTLILAGGTFATEVFNSSGPHSGTVSLDSTTITYTNLAPIIDSTIATSLTINDPMVGDNITVQNGPISPADGSATSAITGSGFEQVDLANKTTVVFNDTSGADDDTVHVLAPLVNNATFTVNASPAITNGPPTAPVALGASYTFQYTAAGSPPPSFHLLPGSSLPSGLTLSPTGLLSGTDTNAADAGRVFTGTVDAGNGIGADATQSYSIAVGPGAILAGSTLYLVGGSHTNDQIAILPAGGSSTGSTGIQVAAILNNAFINHYYSASKIYIVGFAGNDNILLAGTLTLPAIISVGDGNDNILLDNGNNTVTAGNGNDNFVLANGTNSITAGNGNDNVLLGNGANTVTLGNGNDNVVLGGGNNVVRAGKGNDFIQAGNGTNAITAGAVGSTGNIQVQLGNGANDQVTLLGNGNDEVQVGNGAGDSVSISGNGNDEVQVGNGLNDSVSLVGNGNETVQTGSGTGTLHIAGTGKRNLRLGKGWTMV